MLVRDRIFQKLEDLDLNTGYMLSFNFNKNKEQGVHPVHSMPYSFFIASEEMTHCFPAMETFLIQCGYNSPQLAAQ